MWIRIRIRNNDPDPESFWLRIRVIYKTGLDLNPKEIRLPFCFQPWKFVKLPVSGNWDYRLWFSQLSFSYPTFEVHTGTSWTLFRPIPVPVPKARYPCRVVAIPGNLVESDRKKGWSACSLWRLIAAGTDPSLQLEAHVSQWKANFWHINYRYLVVCLTW